MKRLAVIAVVVLAGCQTPQDVRSSGERSVHDLKLPPERAAYCMARNIENYRTLYNPTVRPFGASGYEVVVRFGGDHTGFVAQLEPNGAGSRATVWTLGYMFDRLGARAAMVGGC